MSDNHQNEITESWSPIANNEEAAVLNVLNAGYDALYDAAYTTIDELRQYTPQGLKDLLSGYTPESQSALAEFGNLDIQYENASGDQYLANGEDQITEFTYQDKAGKQTQSFEDIQYNNGQVESFTLNGDKWTRGDSAWTNQKGESLNLGTVSFDKSGLNATGRWVHLGAANQSW